MTVCIQLLILVELKFSIRLPTQRVIDQCQTPVPIIVMHRSFARDQRLISHGVSGTGGGVSDCPCPGVGGSVIFLFLEGQRTKPFIARGIGAVKARRNGPGCSGAPRANIALGYPLRPPMSALRQPVHVAGRLLLVDSVEKL